MPAIVHFRIRKLDKFVISNMGIFILEKRKFARILQIEISDIIEDKDALIKRNLQISK